MLKCHEFSFTVFIEIKSRIVLVLCYVLFSAVLHVRSVQCTAPQNDVSIYLSNPCVIRTLNLKMLFCLVLSISKSQTSAVVISIGSYNSHRIYAFELNIGRTGKFLAHFVIWKEAKIITSIQKYKITRYWLRSEHRLETVKTTDLKWRFFFHTKFVNYS